MKHGWCSTQISKRDYFDIKRDWSKADDTLISNSNMDEVFIESSRFREKVADCLFGSWRLKWINWWCAFRGVSSLDSYHFMEAQCFCSRIKRAHCLNTKSALGLNRPSQTWSNMIRSPSRTALKNNFSPVTSFCRLITPNSSNTMTSRTNLWSDIFEYASYVLVTCKL